MQLQDREVFFHSPLRVPFTIKKLFGPLKDCNVFSRSAESWLNSVYQAVSRCCLKNKRAYLYLHHTTDCYAAHTHRRAHRAVSKAALSLPYNSRLEIIRDANARWDIARCFRFLPISVLQRKSVAAPSAFSEMLREIKWMSDCWHRVSGGPQRDKRNHMMGWSSPL